MAKILYKMHLETLNPRCWQMLRNLVQVVSFLKAKIVYCKEIDVSPDFP